MALQITLVNTPGKISVSRTSQTFNEQGGTLGRAETNTWVLPDPDKFLSSCHCEILCDAGRYYVLDLSTNGTFLNGSHEPLGKGTKVPLNDGDFFEIGDYRFSVKLALNQSFAGTSPFPAPSGAANLDDIFGSSVPTDQSFADPFGTSGVIPDDFSLEPGLETDPLTALDKAHRRPAHEDVFGADHDLFGATTDPFPPKDTFYGGSQLDQTPGLDQAISWPDSNQENLIPEDWEDDLLGSAPIAPLAFSSPPPSPPPIQSDHAPVVPVPPVVRPQPSRPASAVLPEQQVFDPIVSQPEWSVEPQPTIPQPAIPQPVVKQPIATEPVATQPVVTQPVVAQPAVTQPQTAQSAVDSRLISALGLDTSRLSDEQIGEIGEMTGELMREIVDGMMQVLRSRTSIKNEFRMNVTTIQPVENNPLKFSVSVDNALENIFIKKTNAYKQPVEAFQEGFQEIAEHQIAMIAGIRHGFERMMEHFNPLNLEKSFNKQGKSGVIPGLQKAKYWSSYTEYYADFVDNMESSFQHLFGSDFVNAYEDQLRKLITARKKNK